MYDCPFLNVVNVKVKTKKNIVLQYNLQAWTNNLSAVMEHFWREHCEPDNLMDYHEAEMNGGKLGLFSLPLPLYS